MGHVSGIRECDERIGQFLLQQHAPETQHPLPWLLCASNDAPGTRERRIESNNAQTFFVVFMPHSFISKDKENGQVRRESAREKWLSCHEVTPCYVR
jgi:hypothetical protein